MAKQTKAKTEIVTTAVTFMLLLISFCIVVVGIFTEVKNPLLIIPFGIMFVLTSCKLCKIDYEILQAIKHLR